VGVIAAADGNIGAPLVFQFGFNWLLIKDKLVGKSVWIG
jgi:hypothetical protein